MGELDGWRHCPLCSAPLRAVEGRAECTECGFVHYENPKPTASALVVDEHGRLMLSRRAIEPAAGRWDLPGGFVEADEHPLETLHRELREEAGVGLRETEFLGMFLDTYQAGPRQVTTLNLYWRARIADGMPEPADDVAELRFFTPDEIPWDELAFEHLPAVLSAWRGDENP